MTADERINAAWAVFWKQADMPDSYADSMPSLELRQVWRDSITAAVEQEREACARIADDMLKEHWWGENIGEEIRARSTESYGAGFNDNDWDVAEDEGHA